MNDTLGRTGATVIAAAVFVVAMSRGAFVAGGSDSYGYLSQARLWARGSLFVHQRLAEQVSWPNSDAIFSPLGYVPAPFRGAIVPTYPPGYPMVMALAQAALGEGAEFHVVPAAAAGTVLCAYFMGCWMAGPLVGLLAALLLATSPVFLFQSLQPLSDVPATFWWSLAVVLILSGRTAVRSLAGVPVVLAVLTRPNLVALALPFVALAWLSRGDGREGEHSHHGWISVACGLVAAVLVMTYLNDRLFGSAFRSGYGSPRALYAFGYLPINLTRYFGWLMDTETPLVLLAFAAPWLAPRHGSSRRLIVFSVAVIVTVWLSYLCYIAFDSWGYVRFLLPGFPFMFALTLTASVMMCQRCRIAVRRAALLLVAATVLVWHGRSVEVYGVVRAKDSESRYVAVGEYVRTHLPGNAVIVSALHSGSIRYYSGRMTLRYDWVPPETFDQAMRDLENLNRPPFLVLDHDEHELFRRRFGASSVLGRLDWEPIRQFRGGHVAIYVVPIDRLGPRQRP